jgi:hypothetical protein
MRAVFLIAVAGALGATCGQAAETIGKRPYELDWANRTQDHCPPMVDFEDLTGWRVECQEAEARFERTREQQIWGDYIGKLSYRGTGSRPAVRVLPPASIRINQPFDAISLWCYGNNWGWTTDPSTPRTGITALFEDTAGREFQVFLYTVDWKEWNLLHKRLTLEQIERVKTGARFKGLLITGGKNKENRILYFDNLAVFTEQWPPLKFEPRPERNISLLPGQSAGANTGPGRLPFPTRDQTILPANYSAPFTTALAVSGTGSSEEYVFTYEGSDGRLVYRIKPLTGTWSDVVARWEFPGSPGAGKKGNGNVAFEVQPCVDGGIYLQTSHGPAFPEQAEHLGTSRKGEEVESRWRLTAQGSSSEVTYRYRLWNKSLVIDILAPGGNVAEVRFGRAKGRGLKDPRLVTNPFYPADGGRPAVLVSGLAKTALFLAGNADWYLSNGSILWAANSLTAEGATYNGGTRYVPLTNGRRVDCFERFFITISPRYEEVLPTIPNPPSPWKQVTGTRVWRAHGASNREQDVVYWTEVHRYGMTQMVVTDHETLWRDEGESFTFRTRTAPGRGGDASAYDYARLMQDKLGFVYGPYNNFTDFAPVNEFWTFDMVARDPQNQLQHAWMRCYAPKPARAVEYCARLSPQIQEKFHFSTAYCDVHTAVAPWHRVDYDPRAPGAGSFGAVFYSYGEIMLLQKKAWNGPVYSEGNYHCFYMGLTDGNYGQDQSYRPAENPWLVDFDLRQMHDLGCNFGMGNLEMFYANAPQPRATQQERDAEIDRFLAATVAFGHPGFLIMEGGMGNALRSYYMLQQLHSRYCLTNAAEIRYVGEDGQLQETSAAVAGGAFRRSQVITRYADGTVTAANGSRTERLRCKAFGRSLDLPPNGYAGWTADGVVDVFSGDKQGQQCDYAATPAYLYVDGRGRFVRFDKAGGNGVGICRILSDNQHEIILCQGSECGFAIRAESAIAIDKAGRELGPARLRKARGLTYVVPVNGAFSYRLLSAPGFEQAKDRTESSSLVCDRSEAVPGELVRIQGQRAQEARIPADAKPGERVWLEFEGGWIDFTVVPLADIEATISGNLLRITATSHLQETTGFTLQAGKHTTQISLEPNRATTTAVDLGVPTEESADVQSVELRSTRLSQRLELGLRATSELASLVPMPAEWTARMQLRGKPETSDFGASGTIVQPQKIECGDIQLHGLFMHPPWKEGTGNCSALYEPVTLPGETPAAFRARVGKANGSDPGDGILYKVALLDSAGIETVLAQTNVLRHEWVPIQADLSRWAGQSVRFRLITDAGVRDDSSGDWGAWADLRIETLQSVLHWSAETDLARMRHEPGPHPVSDLTLTQLRQAKSGRLHYEGKGLEGPGPYAVQAVLNATALGELASAHGSEAECVFASSDRVPLTPKALESLGRRNILILKNPHGDCFSIRRLWLEVELDDGRHCSSEISTATYTQPVNWPYAEGVRVPAGQDLIVEIWWAVRP